jgi:ABC transport system ATP-binding/permease protein
MAVSAGLTGAAAHAARKDLARVETRMARIETLRAGLHEQMADAHTDHERLLVLSAEDAALAAEHADLEERWLELGEALEG